jgi:hypothetical protein
MGGRSRVFTLLLVLFPFSIFVGLQCRTEYPSLAQFHSAQDQYLQPCSQLAAYTNGQWVPRATADKAKSVFDIGIAHNTSAALHKLECRPRGSKVSWGSFGTVPQDAEDLEEELHHVVQTHNYAFVPERCPLRPFDATQFISYLLQSPRGMFQAGDSLAGQHLNGLLLLLGVLDTASDATALLMERKGNPQRFFANPAHPSVEGLRHTFSEADWAVRLRHPVISFFWTSHLVSDPVLADLLNAAGARNSVGRSRERYPTYKDVEWYGTLAEALVAYADQPEDSPPTVLVLSTGPHWSHKHLDGLPEDALPVVMRTYQAVVSFHTFLQGTD